MPLMVTFFNVRKGRDALFKRGNFFNMAGKSNRAWKFCTVELLVNVIQSAPSSSNRAAAPFRSSVSATVL